MPKRKTLDRRGAMAVFAAIVISVLTIFLGFSVDLAQMQRARTELRVATDLAAKAACTKLADTGSTAAAITIGQEVALENMVAGSPLTLESDDFVFGHSTKSAVGKWQFSPGGSPTNALQITGRRTASSPDGAVALFFSGFLGHTFEPTMTATAAFIDIDICLVLDRSSSMKLATTDTAGLLDELDPRTCSAPWADSRWVALESAVGDFLSNLDVSLGDEQVAVVTFGSDDVTACGISDPAFSTDQDFTADYSQVRDAMAARSNSVWNGNTMIREGLDHARNLVNSTSRPLAEKVIILLTDGVRTSGDPVPIAQQAYDDDGIVVHTITFSDGANQADMQDVASAGRGMHHHAPDQASLRDAFADLVAAITILTE